ncbi:hypothetical protein V6N13_046932 [Hibiscus sabdariffa]
MPLLMLWNRKVVHVRLAPVTTSSLSFFYCGLRDLGYQGPDFTLSQGSTHACLDHMLCNHLWEESFPESSKSASSLSESIANFTATADTWNHTVSGLRGAQRALVRLDHDLQIELENILESRSSYGVKRLGPIGLRCGTVTPLISTRRQEGVKTINGHFPYTGCFPMVSQPLLDSLASVSTMSKGSVDQDQIVKGILNEFGVYSGYRTLLIGNYLGVPVFHQHMQVADFDFILSRPRAKLNGWVASSLLMVGRVTLAKLVLAAIHAFFMQTSKFLTSVCAKIDKIVRGFIWGSSALAHKISLVNCMGCS